MPAEIDHSTDPIVLACATGDIGKLDRLLASSTLRPDGFELWARTAIKNDQPAILKRLFNIPGAKAVHVKGIYITAYLSFSALTRKNPGCLQVLLDNGLNPDHNLGHVGDLVQHSIEYRYPASLKTLLAAGAKPVFPFHGFLPSIALAAGAGQKDDVDLLMEYGAQLQNSMAMHNAAAGSDADMMAWLIDRGGDINEYPVETDITYLCKGQWGTPLHWAAEAKNWDVVEFLLARGADQSMKDAKNRSVLEAGDNDEILRELLERYTNLAPT